MRTKLIAICKYACLVLFMFTALQLPASNLMSKDTEAVSEYYEADRNALAKQLNPEEELVNDTISNFDNYYGRPQLVKMLSNTRQIVLTFDDGPHPRTTPKVLEILRRRHVKAIFFVLGLQAAKYPALVKQIHDEGHLIGNHSYGHKNLAQLSDEKLREELTRTSRLIESITGQKPVYLRPPYGAMNRKVIKVAQQEGMNIMLWTVDPKDWLQKNEASILHNTERQLGMTSGKLHGGALLLHDIYPSTVRALEPLLDRLAAHEFRITSIDNLNTDSNKFWAAAQPRILRSARFHHHFDPDLSGNNALISLLKPQQKNSRSAIAMLKAHKNGALLAYLLNTAS
ncbi:MAG: polysaccharide deacetylase family protein [Candidatus Riflebacteria bacterium]|nr:polysaccharide deacetylase family protein [Candidatus Riflebacteria bacterium]